MWETLLVTLAPLFLQLIQDGIKAQQEGTQNDFAARVQALKDEWTRKQSADANFDASYGPTDTTPVPGTPKVP